MPPDYVKETRFLEEARVELLAAVTYCEQIERGLGARFRDAVEAASALAAKLPGAEAPLKHGTRRVFKKIFRSLSPVALKKMQSSS